MRHHINASSGERLLRAGAAALCCLALANCSSSSKKLSSRADQRLGVSASPRVVEPGQPVPKGGGTYRVGKPYVVAGRTYVPRENKQYRGEGVASWYGDDFHGRLTANGEIYDMEGISAAHPTMPMPSYARVTNLRNGRSLIVRVNDRGPYHADREIDLSRKAAELLDYQGRGLARVRVEYVGPAPLEGSDDRRLLATLREDSTGSETVRASATTVASLRPAVSEQARQPERRRLGAMAQEALARHPIEPVRLDESRNSRASSLRSASADPRPRAENSEEAEASVILASDPAPAATARRQPGVLGTMTVGRGLY